MYSRVEWFSFFAIFEIRLIVLSIRYICRSFYSKISSSFYSEISSSFYSKISSSFYSKKSSSLVMLSERWAHVAKISSSRNHRYPKNIFFLFAYIFLLKITPPNRNTGYSNTFFVCEQWSAFMDFKSIVLYLCFYVFNQII